MSIDGGFVDKEGERMDSDSTSLTLSFFDCDETTSEYNNDMDRSFSGSFMQRVLILSSLIFDNVDMAGGLEDTLLRVTSSFLYAGNGRDRRGLTSKGPAMDVVVFESFLLIIDEKLVFLLTKSKKRFG